MTKAKLITGLLLFISTVLFSQKGKIQGYISDAENKTPLNGATIIISNNKGDNTDTFGKFSINGINPGQYELVVSHVSYKTEIIPVEVKENSVSTVSVAMKKANLDLTEVRINGKKKFIIKYNWFSRYYVASDEYFSGCIKNSSRIIYCAACRRRKS